MRGSCPAVAISFFAFLLPIPAIHATTLSEPVVDTGITVTTPRPDPDLVVIRERYYGASGVDLSAFGIGTGPVDYVQSIYFRYYLQAAGGAEDSILGSVTFPPGVRILGFITNGADLGASSPGSPYIASDAIFAVASNPGDYSPTTRGFEPSGTGAGSYEFICQTDERSFVFGMNVTGGMDDFRVIIDYGTGFGPGLTFQVHLAQEQLGNAIGSRGIRTGDSVASLSPGSGDFGEVTHLVGIPLTTDDPPAAGSVPPYAGRNMVYLSRETGGNPRLDGFDLATGASVPAIVEIPSAAILRPRAVVVGNDGMLYVAGDPAGLASIDPFTGGVYPISTPPQAGVTTRMTTVAGDPRLFILRQTSYPAPEDAFIDTYDTATGIFTPGFAVFPTNMLPHPVDLVSAANGVIYALGSYNGIHSVNPLTGMVSGSPLVIPDYPGENVKGTADPSGPLLYLLRDTTGATFVDSLDTLTGAFRPAVLSIAAAIIPDPAGLVVDNDGMLWVFGKNGGVVGTNPSVPAPQILYQTTCLDFAGFVTYATIPRAPGEVAPPMSATPFDVSHSPTAGMLRFSWGPSSVPGLAYNLYQGTIGAYYSHAPAVCFMPGTPQGNGSLYEDFPTPAGSAYYFLTSSSRGGESSAGVTPRTGIAPECGRVP